MSNYVEINNARHTPITIGMSAWVSLNVQPIFPHFYHFDLYPADPCKIDKKRQEKQFIE
jgi:hypothetical protein